ncbi:septal ring lytic transglycosylase RlpA family protein [Pseudanabaena phage PA-SR01]|nr:septal ring lytic transglycosylase RlpA family protein [Pseudanabaena phage PA-SR01]
MLIKNISAASLALLATVLNPANALAECFYATATYYSNYYEGRKTANGETFSNSGYTAAIADWRGFGSYRVTNERTGASVDVYANDTGDFGDNIDLSQAAFSAIGNLDSGILDVEVCRL